MGFTKKTDCAALKPAQALQGHTAPSGGQFRPVQTVQEPSGCLAAAVWTLHEISKLSGPEWDRLSQSWWYLTCP